MNIFKEYSEYLKNNPEGYWFKRKLYGWGWTPAKWQGWVVILLFVILLICTATTLPKVPTGGDLTWFFVKIFLLVIIIIGICYKKGEKPMWSWGKEK